MMWSDMLTIFWWRKFARHAGFFCRMFLAAMFGKYQHSGWNGVIDYARYSWRGEDYIIPTTTAGSEE